MNTKQIKAVIMHDFKSLKWLLAGFLPVFTLILAGSYYSSHRGWGSWLMVDDLVIYIHLLWGIIIASGIRARDRRIGIRPWLDAMPVKHSSILAVRFITRLIAVIVGPVVFFLIITFLGRYRCMFFLWRILWQGNILYIISIAVSAYCIAAVLAVRAKSQSQAMGIGLISFIIFSALIKMPRMINPILYIPYMPNYAICFLVIILVLCCFFIILNSGSHPDITRKSYYKKSALILLIGFVFVLITGWIAYSMISNLSLEDMSEKIFLPAAVGNKEATIFCSRPSFLEKTRLMYLWLLSKEGTKNIGIFPGSSLKFSPDGNYFAHEDGIFDSDGKKIIRAYPRWWTLSYNGSKWSPDSKYFAVNQHELGSNNIILQFASIENPKEKLSWNPGEIRNSISIIDWIDNNTVILAVGVQGFYKIMTVNTALESRVINEGIHSARDVFNGMRGRIYYNPANSSIIVLADSDDHSCYDIKEVFINEEKIVNHGETSVDHGHLFHADSDKVLFAEFIPDMEPEKDMEIKVMDLISGEETYYYPSPLRCKENYIFYHDSTSLAEFSKFSPNGKYMALIIDERKLKLLELETGIFKDISSNFVIHLDWTMQNNLFTREFIYHEKNGLMEVEDKIFYYELERGECTELYSSISSLEIKEENNEQQCDT